MIVKSSDASLSILTTVETLGARLVENWDGFEEATRSTTSSLPSRTPSENNAELGPLLLCHDKLGAPVMRDPKDVKNAAVAGGKDARV